MMLTAAQSFVQRFRADRALCLLVLLVTSAHTVAGEDVVTPATPPPALSLAQKKDRCKDIWVKGRAYVEADLAELLTRLVKDPSEWQMHDANRVDELTEELVSNHASLAYCDATFTAQDKMPQPEGILGPMSMPARGGAGDTAGASDIDFSMLFASTRCELCRKQVREMNNRILSNLKPTVIRNPLWCRLAAPGEAQEIAVQRTTHREEDTALFQQQYSDRLAALDADAERAAYSNWGSAVDIAAPGSNILSLRAADAVFVTVDGSDSREPAARRRPLDHPPHGLNTTMAAPAKRVLT